MRSGERKEICTNLWLTLVGCKRKETNENNNRVRER